MLTSLKITKWSTSAINFPTKRRPASQVGRILADPYSPARPARVADTLGAWARKVCRPPYFRSPYPPEGVGVPRARPGGVWAVRKSGRSARQAADFAGQLMAEVGPFLK